MATLGSYYIDGPTLASATAVFTDAAMTTPAPDGWYADGTSVREQIGGFLGIVQTCPSCTFPCGSGINTSGNQGIDTLAFNTGNSTGCTIIYFEPFGIPDGIRAQYRGFTWNELTSPTYGFLASTASPNNYTFVGNTANDCGIAAALGGGGYSGQDEYVWDGASFVLQGPFGVVTGAAGDVQLTAGQPGYCTLYIPKPTSTPEDATIEIFGPCSGTAFNVEINCPVQLTGVPTSGLSPADCNTAPMANTYYNVPNRGGTAGEPALNEFFVRDVYGLNKVVAGDYTIDPPSGRKEITVDVNGVITSIAACPP